MGKPKGKILKKNQLGVQTKLVQHRAMTDELDEEEEVGEQTEEQNTV